MRVTSIEAVAAAERLAYRALYQDRLDDLRDGASGLLLALGLVAPADYRLVAWPLLGLAGFGPSRTVAVAKRRLTDRRTGFVRPVSGPGMPRDLYWLIGATVLLATGLFGTIENFTSLPLPSFGEAWPYTLLSGAYLWRARATGLSRYYVPAALPIVAAIIAWPFGDNPWDDFAILLTITGIALLVGGGLTLRRYLHDTPVPNRA